MTYDLDRTILELEAEARNADPAERRQIEAELGLARAERETILAEQDGRISAVFVNASAQPITLTAAEWDDGLGACDGVLRLDWSTGGRVARTPFDGTVRIDGHGIAIVTNRASSTTID